MLFFFSLFFDWGKEVFFFFLRGGVEREVGHREEGWNDEVFVADAENKASFFLYGYIYILYHHKNTETIVLDDAKL